MEATDVLTDGRVPSVQRTYRTTELFLFSAATWNPHRVHYDQSYTRSVEGHDGLLVQGPLQAVHLFEALAGALTERAELVSVRYRHVAALPVDQPVVIDGQLAELDEEAGTATVEMWMAHGSSGQRSTTGTAVVRVPRDEVS